MWRWDHRRALESDGGENAGAYGGLELLRDSVLYAVEYLR